MRSFNSIFAAALLAATSGGTYAAVSPATPRKRVLPKTAGCVNRHTGQPHKHEREIARRLRQQARLEAKRAV